MDQPASAKPYQAAADAVVERLGSSIEQGLDDAEVRRRRDEHGPNRLREARSRSAWRILVDQLASLIVLLLLAAAVAAAVFGRVVEAIAIGAAVAVNTVIGFVMELRATRAMEALQRMGKTRARVRRGGRERTLAADELVPGDIVLLEAGDVVSADLRLLEANRLQCDEAALTGESVPVTKGIAPLERDDPPLAERRNMAFKGTAVTDGSGLGIVVATGMDTELGRISSLVEAAASSATPLERRLEQLGRRLIWLTVAIAAVVAAAGLIAGKALVVMLETAIALAIAAVPEGLPVVATLALARGMHKMARRNAVVKRLSAVETLGTASLIFTDKTGTLTENHMTLARLALADETLTLDQAPDGARFLRDDDTAVALEEAPALAAALTVGALCNNASLQHDGSVGDPTEVALLEGAAAAGLRRDALLERLPEVRELSFDPDVKLMATIHTDDGGYRYAVKGAPEAVLGRCARARTAAGEAELTDAGREDWQARGEALAANGLRVLAIAEKHADGADADPYAALTLLALAGLYDPPRPGIDTTIAACQDAGIRVVMGTGDHAATAQAIATEIGLTTPDAQAVDASQLPDLDRLNDQERERLLARDVFARISPAQKLRLIGLYQDAGWVVGMTGDGVNDAPALKQADIGIAMGQRGTEVAREAADIVLKDDAFETLVHAIEHGRTIFANIRRFIVYLLSGNLAEIMAVSAAASIGAPLPLLPLQILYINFVSDVMPALALGLSPSRAGVMDESPRAGGEPVLERRHWLAITGYGALIAATVLAAFTLAFVWLQLDTGQAVTIGFLTFGLGRLLHVLNMRGANSPMLVNEITRNPMVWIAIAVGIALLALAVWVPVAAEILSIQPLPPAGWLLVAGFSALPVLIVQLTRRVLPRRRAAPTRRRHGPPRCDLSDDRP
ncbi:cation-transporting P-type ATPase [uncultured Thiohalocapsa sp.]|uniref:cation-translocating P-type ATPase n=1 Tax=uncultured Thiohalocapsa sp. TaxID=768990 RepID=UPI0025CD9567|nr:cation-transporting P-type ATPase [uncultured Thiohalocapsa sp.]